MNTRHQPSTEWAIHCNDGSKVRLHDFILRNKIKATQIISDPLLNTHEVEDLVMEVLTNLTTREKDYFQNEEHLENYFFRTCRHKLLNLKRDKSVENRRKRNFRNAQGDDQHDYNQALQREEELLQEMVFRKILEHSKNLTPVKKQVFTMTVFQNKSNKEIAERLKTTTGYVKNVKYRIWKELRAYFSS